MIELDKISRKNKIWIIVLIIIPFVLILLPKTHFDHGIPLCIFTILTGKNCPGCGMTRACMRIVHFDFIGAWEFNKFSLIVFPYFAYQYGKFLYEKFVNVE